MSDAALAATNVFARDGVLTPLPLQRPDRTWVVPDSSEGPSVDHECMTSQTVTRPTGTTTVVATAGAVTAKGWHKDPRGQHKLRFHDGCAWTQHTTHHGPVPCSGCSR